MKNQIDGGGEEGQYRQIQPLSSAAAVSAGEEETMR
jgi:hypothetical protein